MTQGYGGNYRGSVVDNNDPQMANRLLVLVPEVDGSNPWWATPSLPPGTVHIPNVGDEVSVSFERGDTDYPVWEATAATADERPTADGYIGKYRGQVIDNNDPQMQNRILVAVPEVAGSDGSWAPPSPAMAGEQVPDVGTDVWIEFEHGDVAYPVWVGVA